MSIEMRLGDTEIWAADILVSSGAQPNRFIIEGDFLSDDTDLLRDFQVTDGSFTWTFGNCKIVAIENRLVRWGDKIGARYIVEDGRHLWWDRMIAVDFNRPTCSGGRYNEATCQEIFDHLFQFAGVPFANASNASRFLYPTLVSDGEVPVGYLLQELCRMAKHTIGYHYSGLDLPIFYFVHQDGAGGTPRFQSVKTQQQNLLDVSPNFRVISKPTIFESQIDLDPKAMEEDGELVDLASASYAPGAGWSGEWPGHFSGVATASQHLAMKSVYKLFTPGTITNDYAIGSQDITGTSAEILSEGDCAYNSERDGIIVDDVIGEFWPEFHRGDYTTAAGSSWRGVVEHDGNIFRFDRPVFKVTNGSVSAPDLKIKARHLARYGTGSFVTAARGGGDERLCEWVQPVVIHGEGDNLTQVNLELDEYLRICLQEASIPTAMLTCDGIFNSYTTGVVRHARHKVNLGTSGAVESEYFMGPGWGGLEI